MEIVASIYGLVFLVLVIVGVLSWFVWDKRYRQGQSNDIPAGFRPTGEVTIDPVEGKKLRVYFNAATGERFYHEEK